MQSGRLDCAKQAALQRADLLTHTGRIGVVARDEPPVMLRRWGSPIRACEPGWTV